MLALFNALPISLRYSSHFSNVARSSPSTAPISKGGAFSFFFIGYWVLGIGLWVLGIGSSTSVERSFNVRSTSVPFCLLARPDASPDALALAALFRVLPISSSQRKCRQPSAVSEKNSDKMVSMTASCSRSRVNRASSGMLLSRGRSCL